MTTLTIILEDWALVVSCVTMMTIGCLDSLVLLESLLNSLCVKLHAILNGLKIAQAEGYKNCIIESYSTLAGNFVSHRTSQLYPYAPLIQQICHLHRGNLNISFRHTLYFCTFFRHTLER
jgi:hypothetical protein